MMGDKFKRGEISRADLITVLAGADESGFSQKAKFFGYQPINQKQSKNVDPNSESQIVNVQLAGVTPKGQPLKTSTRPPEPFYRIVHYEKIQNTKSTNDLLLELKNVDEVSNEALAAPTHISEKTIQPLVSWPRLLPFIHDFFHNKAAGKKMDIPKLTGHIAKNHLPRHMPKKQIRKRVSRCQIIIEYHNNSIPFHDDYNRLCKSIIKLNGIQGLEIIYFDRGPGERCRRWQADHSRSFPYPLAKTGQSVFILSDLGFNDEARQKEWATFGKRLFRQNIRATVMLPNTPRSYGNELNQWFDIIKFDREKRNYRLRQSKKIQAGSDDVIKEDKNSPNVERLLALLSPAVRVEPALLRAARLLLTQYHADVASEAAVWCHSDVVQTQTAFYYRPEKINSYRGKFKTLAPELQQAGCQLISEYHQHLSELIQEEEKRNCEQLIEGTIRPASEKLLQRVLKTALNGNADELMLAWLERNCNRTHKEIFEHSLASSAAWALSNRDKIKNEQLVKVPEGLDIAQIISLIDDKSYQTHSLYFAQKGENLTLGKTAGNGSPLFNLKVNRPYLQTITGGAETLLKLNEEPPTTLPLRLAESTRFQSNQEKIVLEHITKPDWASAIGRDEYGLYADFTFKGIVQRMRWINPGQFMMGSPKKEKNRNSDELLHSVNLTRGFWLADTACTQALWQAVTGENPARFIGEQNPIEKVSWDDVKQFVQKISAELSELNLRLPSEAEWEYACRAGTATPFSFGENITSDQVNFDGNYPYADGSKGKYRENTVAVKSLPCNRWGLYQMHGNVLEWCEDRFGEYPTGEAIDPIGPESGARRVLRGGSWFNYGQSMRSAYRNRHGPSDRYDYIGFRFARGQ